MKQRTNDELLALRAEINSELARRAGTGIKVWSDRDGRVADTPDGGAMLKVRWRTGSSHTWYQNVVAAEAGLVALADKHRIVPNRSLDGRFAVDLTCDGCASFEAWVEDWS
jgi:hypothetical protein